MDNIESLFETSIFNQNYNDDYSSDFSFLDEAICINDNKQLNVDFDKSTKMHESTFGVDLSFLNFSKKESTENSSNEHKSKIQSEECKKSKNKYQEFFKSYENKSVETMFSDTGKLECCELTKEQYESSSGSILISKTTLENVLADIKERLIALENKVQ